MYNKKPEQNEAYLVLVMASNRISTVLIPDRQSLAEMLAVLSIEDTVIDIKIVSNPVNYREFVNELMSENKPDDLNFGNLN